MNDPLDKDFLEDSLQAARTLIDTGTKFKKLLGSTFISFSADMMNSARATDRLFDKMNSQHEQYTKFEISKRTAENQLLRIQEERNKLLERARTLNDDILPNLESQLRDETFRMDIYKRTAGIRSNLYKKAKQDADLTTKSIDQSKQLVTSLSDQADLATQMGNQVEGYVGHWETANLKLGLIKNLMTGISKIPLLSSLVNAEEVLDVMQRAAASGDSLFTSVTKGFSMMPKSISWLAIAQTAFEVIKLVIGAMFDGDKYLTRISRQFVVSKDAASELLTSYTRMIPTMKAQLANLENIIAAQEQLNSISAFSFKSTQSTLDSQIQLTQEYGVGVDESTNLNRILSMNNEEGNIGLENIRNTVTQYMKGNKIIIRTDAILKKVADTTGELRLRFQGSVANLTQAVIRADKLGISLNQAKSAASGLLDFQSSISNELEAELLLGKQLYFDRARMLALQGDYLGAQEIVLSQLGDYDQLTKMNTVQLQASAKAAGMTVDELESAAFQAKYLTIEAKKFKDSLATDPQAQRNFDDIFRINKGQLDVTMRQVEASRKFENSVQHIKDTFVTLVSNGVLDQLASALEKIAASLSMIFGANNIQNIRKTNNEISELTTSLEAADPSKKDSIQQAIKDKQDIIAASIADEVERAMPFGALKQNLFGSATDNLRKQQNKKQDDFISRGNTITPFRKDDIVMAGTSLLGGRGDNEIKELLKELISIVKTGGDVHLDGRKVGYAQLMGQFKSA